MPTTAAKKDEPKTPTKGTPKNVVPPKPSGKEETRLFQRGPDERAWLTKDQAKAEGFFWADDPNV